MKKVLFAVFALSVSSVSFADMGHFQGTPSGTWGWSGNVGSGMTSQSGMGGGHLNPTNDGFKSAEGTPSTNPIERMWFYIRKGTSMEFAVNSSQSSNAVNQSEQTTTALLNVPRTMVTNHKDAGTGSQVFQVTITATLIPVGAINQTDPGASRAAYKYDWSVKNISTTNQSLSFYGMGDLMATRNGSSGNADDTLTLDAGGIGQKYLRGKISSPQGVGSGTGTIPTIYYSAVSDINVTNAEFSAGTTPAARTKMTDTLASTLSGSTSNVTGNVGLAIQYDMTLAAGASQSGTVYLGYNAVPEPGSMMAIAAGIAGLVARKRKKS